MLPGHIELFSRVERFAVGVERFQAIMVWSITDRWRREDAFFPRVVVLIIFRCGEKKCLQIALPPSAIIDAVLPKQPAASRSGNSGYPLSSGI